LLCCKEVCRLAQCFILRFYLDEQEDVCSHHQNGDKNEGVADQRKPKILSFKPFSVSTDVAKIRDVAKEYSRDKDYQAELPI